MTDIDTRPYTYEFTVTREAMDAVHAMNNRVDHIGQTFGIHSKEYVEANESLRRALATVFGRAFASEVRVSRDSDLSLLVTGGITFGMIFHGTKRGCLVPGCRAVIESDGKAWTYSSDWQKCADGDHKPTYPLDFPMPGAWSFHS